MVKYDAQVAVIGLGANGGQALYQLAKRGISAIGLEQYWAPNERSGHAGEHRVLHPLPFSPERSPDHEVLNDIMPAWKQFQKETNSNIVLEHGVLLFGHEGDEEFEVIAQNARNRDGHDRNVLSAETLRKQYPLFRTPDDGLGVFDEQGGAVRSEMAVYAAVHGAQKLGAEVRTDTKVHGWAIEKDRVRVFTRDREFVVEKLVVSPGAYVAELLPHLPIRARRLVMGWFTPEPDYVEAYSDPKQLPAFHGSIPHRRGEMIYGAGSLDKPYVKIGADFNWGLADEINQTDFHVVPEDLDGIRMMARERFVGLDDAPLRSIKLMDGWTVDFEALVGNYGPSGRVVLATGFSGYGFTVAPVMGQIVADLVEKDETSYNIEHLSPNRFTEPNNSLAEWWGVTGGWNRSWSKL
ncbi:FAD-dependent oxidoreductase [Yaniella sp.]|uniref:FAD-dependent oxidoreductase n=1 Tax=Yaniella sp. TaxID=2773929 RepID=UPI002649BE99|nr:FAD-dependent oxidoreductase [Yaniella sp.]MDN5816267.1 FAD-dependent oxidoreductase [Yaniella sp.]